MKRFIQLILVIFLSTQLSAQEEEKLLSACRQFNYGELQQELNDLIKGRPKEYELKTRLNRELVNGFFEELIELKITGRANWDSELPFAFKYEIRLIKKKDGKMAYYKINRFDEKEDEESSENIQTEITSKEASNQELEKLKAAFQKVYGIPLNLQALFETTIEYGSRCGFSGSQPEYRVKLDKLINAREKDSLASWLKSPVAEIQLYAIDGILALKKSGVKFSKSVLKLIQVVERKEGYANSCSGCFYENTAITTLVREIKTYHDPKTTQQKENPANY